MKKTILAVVLVITAVLGVYGQNTSPNDIILLLDTSSNMNSSYENVTSYITGPFLSEFLRVGDTFHLIPFSQNPRLDVARRIIDTGDVETIAARMLLQYPVESENNAGSALSYAERYVTSLPSRPKKIILITTGSQDTGNLVSASRQRLGSLNATLDYIQVTPGRALSNLPVSGRPQTARSSSPVTSSAGTSSTGTSRPGVSDDASRSSASDISRSGSSQPDTSSSQTQGTGITDSRTDSGSSSQGAAVDGTPSSMDSTSGTPGSSLSVTGITDAATQGASSQTGITPTTSAADSSDNKPVNQNTTPVNQSTSSSKTSTSSDGGSGSSFTLSLPLIIGLILGLLLLLLLILFLSSRRLGSSPNRVMAEASSSPLKEDNTRFKDHSKDLATYAASAGSVRRSTPYDDHFTKKGPPVINPTGPLLLNLFVEDQNTAIGKRNIHSLKSGYNLSVGGGKSDDYFIFLVPIPAGIGEIRRDGSTLTFIPRKAKYFPDIGNNQIRDCINKTIRIVSDKKYEMRFRFEMYEDPLIALNRMLNSVKVPG